MNDVVGKKAVVTGGAGFIGSHLAWELAVRGAEVHALDNLSGGRQNLGVLAGNNKIFLHKVDLTDAKKVRKVFEELAPQAVFHFAANPNAGLGAEAKRSHLNHNVVATYNVLEAAAACGTKKFVFASTSTVYGRAQKIPTPESEPFKPISLYGATKVAGEALASSFAENYGFSSTVLRYANVVGPRSTHGVIIDFVNKLRANPKKLEVLGDGRQEKSYVYVDDVVQATLLASEKNNLFYNAFNVGSEDTLSALGIAEIVSTKMGLTPKISCAGGIAWKGDVTRMLLDCAKLKKLGWKAASNSRQAVEETVEALEKTFDSFL